VGWPASAPVIDGAGVVGEDHHGAAAARLGSLEERGSLTRGVMARARVISSPIFGTKLLAGPKMKVLAPKSQIRCGLYSKQNESCLHSVF
jgi:hypothetical protein